MSIPSLYITSHSVHLSFLSSAGRAEMSIRQGEVAVLCGWEDNRRSGIADGIRHRLCYIHIRGQWPKEGR